jgi:hypothetical protein
MVCSCYIKGLRWLPVGVVAFFVLAQPLQSLGGEKIQISGRTSKGSQSDESLKSGLYSDPLDFMKSRGSGGGGSLVPSLPPPVTSSRTRPKQEEDNSWMFDADGKLDQSAALEKIFGVRNDKAGKGANGDGSDSDFGKSKDSNGWGNGKNWLEDGYRKSENEAAKAAKPRTEANTPFEVDQERSFLRERRDRQSNELNMGSYLAPKQSNDVFSTSTRGVVQDPFAMGDFTKSFESSQMGRFGRTKDQEQRLSEFNEMLGVQPSLFSDQLRSVLNAQPDTTRRELNPVLGQSMEQMGISGKTPSSLDPFGSGARSPVSDSGFFNSFNSRAAQKASLSPAMISVPSAPVFQERPTVLEMPRRRF